MGMFTPVVAELTILNRARLLFKDGMNALAEAERLEIKDISSDLDLIASAAVELTNDPKLSQDMIRSITTRAPAKQRYRNLSMGQRACLLLAWCGMLPNP